MASRSCRRVGADGALAAAMAVLGATAPGMAKAVRGARATPMATGATATGGIAGTNTAAGAMAGTKLGAVLRTAAVGGAVVVVVVVVPRVGAATGGGGGSQEHTHCAPIAALSTGYCLQLICCSRPPAGAAPGCHLCSISCQACYGASSSCRCL